MQVGKNTNCFCWCCLHGNPTKFPLLKCTEVVPISVGHRLLTRSHFNHSVNTLGRTYSGEHSFVMTSGWPTTRPELIFPRFHAASLDSGLHSARTGRPWPFSAEPRIDTPEGWRRTCA